MRKNKIILIILKIKASKLDKTDMLILCCIK